MTSLLIILNLIAMTIHQLPQLPYALNALEPQISEETMQYHYGKHHQAYITNLNNLIVGTKFENMSLHDIVMESDGAIFNNAAQTFNHTFFFLTLSSNPKSMPSDDMMRAIIQKFGSFDNLIEQMSKAAIGQFGSGWAWLVANKNGELSILATSNADNPLRHGLTPLACIDVWEHAYYIDYRNRRADFIKGVFERFDWAKIEERWHNSINK